MRANFNFHIKFACLITVLFISVHTINAQITYGPNLVLNPGFEAGLTTNWLNSSAALESTYPVTELKSARLTSGTGFANVNQVIGVVENTTYRFSFKGRILDVAGANGGASTSRTLSGTVNSGNSASGTLLLTITITQGTDIVVSGEFTVPVGVTQVFIKIAKPNGFGYVDDVKVEAKKWDITTNTDASSISCTDCAVKVAAGAELTVSENKTLPSVTVGAGGKLSLTAGTLTATNGITLESDATGTATMMQSGTIVGTVNAKQYLGSARNWYVSSPVSSAGAPATNMDYYYEYMEGGNNNDFATQPGSSTLYWKGLANGTTMEVGKGYIAKTNAGTTVLFSGTPNNGDITTTFNLTRNDAKGKGFNLVGNPYPSYIDWTDVAAANPNLENTYYYRTKNTNIANTYTFVTWNGAGSGSYVVSNGSLPVNTIITSSIPPTQAFWVRVKSGTETTNMNFNNGMREHRLDNNNLMKARKQDTRTSLRLQLHNGTESDEMLVYIDGEASNNYDAYDSPKMMNNSASVPDLYSKIGNEQLVINGLKEIVDNMELPLGFSLNAAASLKLKVNEISNLPVGTRVYLRDKVDIAEIELTPEKEYTFSTAATTNNESRFSLLFKTPSVTTGTSNVYNERISIFVNAQNEIVIFANENSNYAIYNTVGQLIENGILNSEHRIQNSNLFAGVYIVKVGNQSTRVIVK